MAPRPLKAATFEKQKHSLLLDQLQRLIPPLPSENGWHEKQAAQKGSLILPMLEQVQGEEEEWKQPQDLWCTRLEQFQRQNCASHSTQCHGISSPKGLWEKEVWLPLSPLRAE